MPQSAVTKTENKTSTLVSADSADYKQKTMEVYFPGPDFVATTYGGRISVFRARRQPLNRIRDSDLGWGKLARGGVEVHLIPGGHDTVLKEPHVQGLAAALKKCLLQRSEQASS